MNLLAQMNHLPSDTITPIEFKISSNNVSCWDDADGMISVEVLTNMLNPFSYYINGVIKYESTTI